MTPDIVKLRETLPTLESIIDRLELELVDDPAWGEPSDTSYLSEAERQNPDIAANVDAMAETNKLIAWFGRDAEGFVGLWRGPNGRSLNEAPVVRLDTEGQYSIVAATVPEYLAIAMPEDEFASTREALTAAGFRVGFNPDAIWGALDAFDDDPNTYRNELYEQNRVARGLPRTDADDEPAGDEAGASDEGGESDEGGASEEATIVEPAPGDGVPEPEQFATGSMPAMPVAVSDDDDDEFDTGEADLGGDDEDVDDEDEGDIAIAAPPPAAKQAAKRPAAKKPAKKAAAKKPMQAKKKAAKPAKPAKKAAAKKAPKKPAKKAPKKPAKKAAKAAAKKPAAKKPAAKKSAAKPAKKKRR